MVRPKLIVWVICATLALQGCASRPHAFSLEEYQRLADYNLGIIKGNQQSVSESIDLYQAMARAIKYNLNYRVKIAETRLANSKIGLMHHALLPKAVANSNYTARNNFLASSSFNLETGSSNFGASTSQEKIQNTQDLSFSWNILDFGLSYVRAQQAGDNALISAELQDKVVLSLLEEVRSAYWLATSNQRMARKLQALKKRIQKARKNTRMISASGETSISAALLEERELIKITDSISKMQREHITAKSELAILMGIQPGTAFELTTTTDFNLPSKLKIDASEMVTRAIRDRVELHENWYQQRINKREATAAMLELLPGLDLFTGDDWSSNSFLLNGNWISWGAKASWNLMNIFKYPIRKRVIEEQDEVLQARALALTIAIMAQVHVSRTNYQQRIKELEIAAEYRSIQKRLIRQLRVEATANLISENKLLREEMNTLIAETRFDIANANAQSAYGNLFTTIGWNPADAIDSSLSASDIANSLWANWKYPDRPATEQKLMVVQK